MLIDSKLVPEPKIPALANLLSEPLIVCENTKRLRIDPTEEPKKFLENMTRAIHDSYSWGGGGGVKWTIEKPTVPGWYWYRLSTHDTNPAMAHVYEFGGHLNAVWSNGKSVYIQELPGEWAGPLEPP